MQEAWKDALWQQFGAALDALVETIRACPADMWQHEDRWYLVYHTLFWADLYLSGEIKGFQPPIPYGLEELDPAGVLPPRAYTQEEMLEYAAHCRAKCFDTIQSLDDEKAKQRFRFAWGEASFFELLLYNMRHVQHGAGQMNLQLSQKSQQSAPWVPKARA